MYCDAKEIRFRNREEFTMKSKAKTFLIDILLDIVGGCFIAIGGYNFAVASGFPVAGISGIAIVFYYFWKIPIGTMTTILNIPIILICYKLLGKQFFLRSIKTMLISNILMDWVVPLFPIYQGDMMLSCICMSVFSGIGYAIIYMRDTSTGGTGFGSTTGAGVYSYMAFCTSFGMSTKTGPGRPDFAIWKAVRTVSARSSIRFTKKLCLVIGMVLSVMSTSWKLSRPIREFGTFPVMATIGMESR